MISLSAETQRMIEERMKKGGYQSADDAVRAALATLDQQEDSSDFAAGELDELLSVGDAEIERSEVLDGEEVFREIRELGKARRGKAG